MNCQERTQSVQGNWGRSRERQELFSQGSLVGKSGAFFSSHIETDAGHSLGRQGASWYNSSLHKHIKPPYFLAERQKLQKIRRPPPPGSARYPSPRLPSWDPDLYPGIYHLSYCDSYLLIYHFLLNVLCAPWGKKLCLSSLQFSRIKPSINALLN